MICCRLPGLTYERHALTATATAQYDDTSTLHRGSLFTVTATGNLLCSPYMQPKAFLLAANLQLLLYITLPCDGRGPPQYHGMFRSMPCFISWFLGYILWFLGYILWFLGYIVCFVHTGSILMQFGT